LIGNIFTACPRPRRAPPPFPFHPMLTRVMVMVTRTGGEYSTTSDIRLDLGDRGSSKGAPAFCVAKQVSPSGAEAPSAR